MRRAHRDCVQSANKWFSLLSLIGMQTQTCNPYCINSINKYPSIFLKIAIPDMRILVPWFELLCCNTAWERSHSMIANSNLLTLLYSGGFSYLNNNNNDVKFVFLFFLFSFFFYKMLWCNKQDAVGVLTDFGKISLYKVALLRKVSSQLHHSPVQFNNPFWRVASLMRIKTLEWILWPRIMEMWGNIY